MGNGYFYEILNVADVREAKIVALGGVAWMSVLVA